MTNEMQLFAQATEKVLEQLKAIVTSEQDKRRALLNNDMSRLETLLPAQQAMIMQLESFEKKRVAAQCAAGMEEKTSSEILAAVNETDKAALGAMFEAMHNLTAELRELNKASLDIAGNELKIIEQLMRTSVKKESGLYQPDGKKGPAHTQGTAFEEKI